MNAIQTPQRALASTRSILQKPCPLFPKRLYFKDRHTLTNRMGHEFNLEVGKEWIHPNYNVFIIRRNYEPQSGAYIRIVALPRSDQVYLNHLRSFEIGAPCTTLSADFSKPPSRMRGYGFLHVAVFLSTCVAKRMDISRITIKPNSLEVFHYYEKSGFIPHGISKKTGLCEYMVLPMERQRIKA